MEILFYISSSSPAKVIRFYVIAVFIVDSSQCSHNQRSFRRHVQVSDKHFNEFSSKLYGVSLFKHEKFVTYFRPLFHLGSFSCINCKNCIICSRKSDVGIGCFKYFDFLL